MVGGEKQSDGTENADILLTVGEIPSQKELFRR